MVAHIVLFNPKRELTTGERQSFAQSVRASVRRIGGVQRALIGKAVAVTPQFERSFGDKTYEYAAVLEFPDTTALRDYLNHPVHRELGRLFWDNCESAVVMEADLADALTEELADLV
jgi:hypothetical protein